MSKSKIIDQFKQAVAQIRDHLDAEHRPVLQQAERAFGELRQHDSTLQSRVEEVEAELRAARHDAQTAKSEAAELRQRADSLTQRIKGKEGETARLQQVLASTKALLLEQTAKGYNVEMIKDFLVQLEMDLQTALYENERPSPVGARHPREQDLRYFFRRYGQYGAFVPMSMTYLQSDPSEAAKATEIQLIADMRDRNIETYRAELAHLLALKDRFAFALECCNRPREQFCRVLRVEDDGNADTEEGWDDVEAVGKALKKANG